MSEEQNKRDHCAEVQGSPYLIACDDRERERRKEWLYEILGPVFFGEKEAADAEELRQLFQEKYGIDVQHDFVEGDEHYDEYLEAQQAIAEGMSIYGGEISFGGQHAGRACRAGLGMHGRKGPERLPKDQHDAGRMRGDISGLPPASGFHLMRLYASLCGIHHAESIFQTCSGSG